MASIEEIKKEGKLYELYPKLELTEFKIEYEGLTLEKKIYWKHMSSLGSYFILNGDESLFLSDDSTPMWDCLGHTVLIYNSDIPIVVFSKRRPMRYDMSYDTCLIYPSLNVESTTRSWNIKELFKYEYLGYDDNFIYFNNYKNYYVRLFINKGSIIEHTISQKPSKFIYRAYVCPYLSSKKTISGYLYEGKKVKYIPEGNIQLYLTLNKNPNGHYELPYYENRGQRHGGMNNSYVNYYYGIGKWFGPYFIHGNKRGRVFTLWDINLIKYMAPCLKESMTTILLCLKTKPIWQIPKNVWMYHIFPHLAFNFKCLCPKNK